MSRCRRKLIVVAAIAGAGAALIHATGLRFGHSAVVTPQSPLAVVRQLPADGGDTTFARYVFEADAEAVAPVLAKFAAEAKREPPREHGPPLVLNDLDAADFLQVAQKQGDGHFLDANGLGWNGWLMPYLS